MLDWVTGASRSQSIPDPSPEDAPETPAHLFAARAFKSLIFGTPAPNDMTVEKAKKSTKTMPKPSRRHSSDVPRDPTNRQDSFVSPSKGILVVPGSISNKRKSVTFGSLGRDSNGRKNSRRGMTMEEEEQVPVPALKPFNFDPDSIEEDLRKSLFASREVTQASEEPSRTPAIVEGAVVVIEEKDIAAPVDRTLEKPVLAPSLSNERKSRFLEDQTIDLDQPRSTSGQHWKREYERDHDKSKAEMKKIIRYSQMTKSYAEKRDKDVIVVTQKLEEAETKARSLELQIRKLAAQLMDAKTHGEEQDLILSEVASQTAEVMKQKGNAEKYRAALRKFQNSQPNIDEDSDKNADATTSVEVAELKSELLRVRLAVDRAEAKAAKADYDRSVTDAKLHQVEDSNKELLSQYNKLQDRLSRRASRLLEENRTLNDELAKVNLECSTVKEELEELKKANKESKVSGLTYGKDRLFDLDHPRLTKEPSPPTSDEDLRERSRATNRSTLHRMEDVFTEDMDTSYTPKRNGTSRRLPHKKSMSTPSTIPIPSRNVARLEGRQSQQINLRAALAFDSESERETGDGRVVKLEDQAIRNGSPLMKSFVDNLGSRRVLPAERVAAAKRRLEEKAADRRSTPMYTKVHDKIIV